MVTAEQEFLFHEGSAFFCVVFQDFDPFKKTCQKLAQKTYKNVHLPFAT